MEKRNKKIFGILFLTSSLLLSPLNTYSQGVSVVNDNHKYKQLNSMENGGWGFAPDWYYYILHKNYSGAEMYWEWVAFVPVPHVRFKEEKSSQKRSFVPRAAQIPAVVDNRKRTQTELDSITPVYNEEMARAADRNVDLMYSQYKSDFEKMQTAISGCLTYSLNKSNGRLAEAVEAIRQENELVLSQVEYIHKTGIGYEMENAKRQTAYEEAREKMRKVLKLSTDLVYYSKVHY